MTRTAIVTDSSADLPAGLLDGKPVFLIPLQISWNDETYLDGVDIQPVKFYERLKTSHNLPTTSQPSPGAFHSLYRRLLEQGFHVLSIHISAGLSGTFNSALQAKKMLIHDAPVEVVDSQTGSIALGLQVLNLAESALRGASLQECKNLAESARHNACIFFVLDTLEYLRRSGRVGGASAFLGTLLHIKPILETRQGIIEVVDKARSMKKALGRVLEILDKRLVKARSVSLAVVHANTPHKAQDFLDQAVQHFSHLDITNAFCANVSPALATHTGPSGLGLAYLFE
jgi:DegV family protein with EDD domain